MPPPLGGPGRESVLQNFLFFSQRALATPLKCSEISIVCYVQSSAALFEVFTDKLHTSTHVLIEKHLSLYSLGQIALNYTCKNATDLLQPVAPSGLNPDTGMIS